MQRIVVNVYIAFLFLLSVLFGACGSNGIIHADKLIADSIHNDIAVLKYKSALQLRTVTYSLDSMSHANGETCDVAKNGMAYADFLMMNFADARKGYNNVIENSENEIDILAAEVGMMQLCYRTSANKEFFDFRSSAIRRIRRIDEEKDMLPSGELQRFLSARMELAAVSLCYFVNLGMTEEAQRAANYLHKYSKELHDPTLHIYASMILNYKTDIPVGERIKDMRVVLRRAVLGELNWLTANSRLMLAVLLRDNPDLISNTDYSFMSSGAASYNANELPFMMAMKAAEEFSEFGDRYMMIEALAVAASCQTYNDKFQEALSTLERAMNEINTYYNSLHVDEMSGGLSLYEIDEEAEYARMDNKDIYNIHECLLSVRREASCAFAGIGDKYLSDINRNSYLDLLRTIRLNKQMESRTMAAEKSAERLYIWLACLLALLMFATAVSVCLNIKWRNRNKIYVGDLTAILRVCRMLMSKLPQDLSDEKGVYRAVSDILNSELKGFVDGVSFAIVHATDSAAGDGFVYDISLPQMDGNGCVLRVVSRMKLPTSKKDMLGILLPYISVAIDEGKRIADIADEQSRLEQQHLLYTLYLSEHKRENVVKRTLMSVVNGMFPYMNRMLHELNRLVASRQKGDGEKRRLGYLSELTAVLDDYNVALENWIKMSRGELSLHIENFSLSELMAIIAKGERAFAMKGIKLVVQNSGAVVKADKALTLFMMNTLVDNAGKFTHSGGTVQLAATEGEDYVEISVTDTGVGMSDEKVNYLINSKVYMPEAAAPSSSARKGGFGIMNCKWIIDKYRKTDALFSVCRLDIASELGKGSRFSFRLPKGVLRKLLLWLLWLVPCGLWANDVRLENIASLADSVYTCNVQGRYNVALEYAAQAIDEFNILYKQTIGGSDTISLSSGGYSEIDWWRNNLFPDSLTENIYYNLLDVRNETAVAALAVNNWTLYRYNNAIYTLLYRLVHEDSELVVHYENMREIANYRYAAVAVCAALLLLLLVAYIVMYVRHVIMQRMNTRMLLDTNSRLLRVVGSCKVDIDDIASNLAREIYNSVEEQLSVGSITVLLKNGDGNHCACYPQNAASRYEVYAYRACDTATAYMAADDTATVLPLIMQHADEQLVQGAIVFETARRLNKNELVTLELIVSYAASMVYYSTVCLAAKYSNLDDVEEETERAKFEENNMHVRNLVLDNCLSVIKHETIYYPGRIRNLVRQLAENDFDVEEWHSKVSAVREVVDYYNSVLSVLAECAMRQLDDISFAFSNVNIDDIVQRVGQSLVRKMSKKGLTVELQYNPSSQFVHGDKTLVEFLFETIFRILESVRRGGIIQIKIYDDGICMYVEIVDTRCRLSHNDIATLFVPTGKNNSETSYAQRMEFLIAKEIIRMHEDATGKRGGRIEVAEHEQGTLIAFALPK